MACEQHSQVFAQCADNARRVNVLEGRVAELSATNSVLRPLLQGNGKPGLVTRIHELEQLMGEWTKQQEMHRLAQVKALYTMAAAVALSALAGIGSVLWMYIRSI